MEQVNGDMKMSSSIHKKSSYAPWYTVPKQPIVSVEHPFIIQNIDKGLETLGSPRKLQEVSHLHINRLQYFDVCQLVQEDGATANLYLKPGDRMAKPLRSANVSTNNVLLKVTVPKRTGRKRRRGSGNPLHEGAELGIPGERAAPMLRDAEYLFRSMRDNTKRFQVEMVGTINHTHRFRGMQLFMRLVSCALIQPGMPDFVTSTKNMPLTQKFRDHILPFECKAFRSFYTRRAH